MRLKAKIRLQNFTCNIFCLLVIIRNVYVCPNIYLWMIAYMYMQDINWAYYLLCNYLGYYYLLRYFKYVIK